MVSFECSGKHKNFSCLPPHSLMIAATPFAGSLDFMSMSSALNSHLSATSDSYSGHDFDSYFGPKVDFGLGLILDFESSQSRLLILPFGSFDCFTSKLWYQN
ncbi:hypothetical protein EVAR_90657_1 [Eumeta japonica]|uniref:Uncharacterized protein n=1 Tax=Eumeta variegata TaxID=151549 RepID=A0A4C1ZE34_EUMVA|nr:hypothetical protein EVAR_90657_1 [Eumeta japonica]